MAVPNWSILSTVGILFSNPSQLVIFHIFAVCQTSEWGMQLIVLLYIFLIISDFKLISCFLAIQHSYSVSFLSYISFEFFLFIQLYISQFHIFYVKILFTCKILHPFSFSIIRILQIKTYKNHNHSCSLIVILDVNFAFSTYVSIENIF